MYRCYSFDPFAWSKIIIKAIINFKQQILTLSNTNFQKLDHTWSAKNSRFKSKVAPDMISYSPFDLVTSPIHNMQLSSKQYRVKLIFSTFKLVKLLSWESGKTLRSDKIKNAIKILSKAKQVRSMLVVLWLSASKSFHFLLLR